MLHFVRSYQAGGLAILLNDKTTPSRSQDIIIDKCLQVEAVVDNLPVARHYVIDAHAAQPLDCFELQVTGSGRVQKEPTYEGQPQAAKAGSIKETNETNNDECE